MARIKIEPQLIYKELQNGRNYKSSENMYDIIARNERFKAGIHWKGINSKNLPKTVYNYIKQAANIEVADVMAQQITINRSPDELSTENETVVKASKVFTEMDRRNWERLTMDAFNEDMLMDAYLAGLGATHWFWDDTIKSGNDFIVQGDIDGELLDSVQIYVSNPNEIDIQKQDWVILSIRKTISQVIEIAKANKVPENEIEMIKGNETTNYEAYDKAQNEQDSDKLDSNQTDLVYKYWKEDGTVRFTQVTQEVTIKKPTDTELTRYPIATMNWEKRKRSFYGNSPVTEVIANQQVANKQASQRHLHATLMAIPKVIVNKAVVGGFTNTIGGMLTYEGDPTINVNNLVSYVQPTQMTIDVDKSIDDSINRTRELMGINQNVTGESNPDNFRAIVAQQKAAGVPRESVKRRFFKYIEDVALIWQDFYQHKYNMERKIMVEDGEEKEMISFQGTDFKDVFLKTKIDVGASTQWSELLQIDAMNSMWDKGIIKDPVLYVERIPENVIPQQEELVEALGGGDEAVQAKKTAMFELMAMFLETQSPEEQQRIMSLPEEEQEQAIVELVNQQPEPQPQQPAPPQGVI